MTQRKIWLYFFLEFLIHRIPYAASFTVVLSVQGASPVSAFSVCICQVRGLSAKFAMLSALAKNCQLGAIGHAHDGIHQFCAEWL